MNDQDLIRIKIFSTAKETISKIKRQPMEGVKIFANDMLDKGLLCTMYKELTQVTPGKYNTVKQWAEVMNRHFSKGDIQMAPKHMKQCSTSLIIRKIQIKATLRYHLTLVSVAKMSHLGNQDAGEDMEKD